LLATGRQQEALQLARGRVDERPDDLSAHLSLALFLYLARRFAEAEELARDVAESHPHSWLARFIQAFVALGTGTYEVRNAPTYYARLAKEILQVKEHYGFQYKVDEVFPGCFCLVNYCVNSYRVQEREWLNAQRLRYLEEKSGGWNGIRYEKIKEDYHLREKNWGELAPSNFAAEIYWTPLQLALGYVAVGDNDSAIVLIQEAVEQGDPLTIWLPMLPLFDSLREDSTFQTIIERMQFPGPK
jgi:FimV-like protein